MEDEGFKRKLTAILSADAEGYSRLMGYDAGATIRILTTYSHENITDFKLYRRLKATIAQKKTIQ
jgi:adenylate cyclase